MLEAAVLVADEAVVVEADEAAVVVADETVVVVADGAADVVADETAVVVSDKAAEVEADEAAAGEMFEGAAATCWYWLGSSGRYRRYWQVLTGSTGRNF